MSDKPKSPLDLTEKHDEIPETMALDVKQAHDKATLAVTADQQADLHRAQAPTPAPEPSAPPRDAAPHQPEEPQMRTVGGKSSDWIAQAKAEMEGQQHEAMDETVESVAPSSGGGVRWVIAVLVLAALLAGGWWYWSNYLR